MNRTERIQAVLQTLVTSSPDVEGAALVVLVPVALMLWERDTTTALRYGVLVGVVGAAVVLPRTGEVAVVAAFAAASLVVADALLLGLGAGRVAGGHLARWVIESGVIFSVATLVSFLHLERARAAARLRGEAAAAETARREWETTFDNLSELVVICDREGTVTRVNRAFAKALGARPLELAGRPLEAVLAGHPDRWWTASADGIPNVTYLSRAHKVDDERIAISNQFMSKTSQNLAANPRAGCGFDRIHPQGNHQNARPGCGGPAHLR